MSDVPTMLRTSQAVRRWRHFALCMLPSLFLAAFWALFLWAMWRAV